MRRTRPHKKRRVVLVAPLDVRQSQHQSAQYKEQDYRFRAAVEEAKTLKQVPLISRKLGRIANHPHVVEVKKHHRQRRQTPQRIQFAQPPRARGIRNLSIADCQGEHRSFVCYTDHATGCS